MWSRTVCDAPVQLCNNLVKGLPSSVCLCDYAHVLLHGVVRDVESNLCSIDVIDIRVYVLNLNAHGERSQSNKV